MPLRREPIVDRKLRALAPGAVAVLIGRTAPDVGVDDDLVVSERMKESGCGA